ncbi:MAG: ABC transporter ATP-binding protein [Paracoccaceae bacterium]
MLQVENLTKSYATADGRTQVLDGVSFGMKRGETLALTGESGSGKSTLLHLIGGLDRPDAGHIILDGTDMAELDDRSRAALRRGTVGIVFQQFNLIPSLTVAANIAFQARLAGRHDQGWTDILIGRIGLVDQLDKYPEALSGGQQQRVAIARTLAARPKLVLADEPTGNLDEDNAEIILTLLLETAREAGTSVLMVTHSLNLAARLQRRLHLSHGRIIG